MQNKTKIVFASGNAGKIKEMTYLINKNFVGTTAPGRPHNESNAGINQRTTGGGRPYNNFEIELLSLKDVGFTDEIIENGKTFEENAEIKARAVFEKTGMICFADDSGLCIDYLNGAPGIFSARYGDGVPGEGTKRILRELDGVPDEKRTAHFYCAICCVISKTESFFVSGKCEGIVTHEKIGENGFGYDPIFYYPPADKTFAQISDEEKNKVSHRAMAAEQFAEKIVKYI